MPLTSAIVRSCPLILCTTLLVASTLLTSCSTQPKLSTSPKDPLELYLVAQKSGEAGEYSTQFLQSKAARYLFEKGKSELRIGNSISAVQDFARARDLSPWNDDIKDFYVLSVRTLVNVTNELQSESCDVVLDRLNLIYALAPDQITELSEQTKRCGFKPNNSSTSEYQALPLSKRGEITESKAFETLRETIDRTLKHNRYVPRKELLLLGLNYLSDLSIQIGKPEIGSESANKDRVRALLPISMSYKGKTRSLEYCESAKEILHNPEFEEQVDDPRFLNRMPGFMKCDYFSSFSGKKELAFYSIPSWIELTKTIWPLPTDLVIDFVFHYSNGTKATFRNVVSTFIQPVHVETGVGSRFMFTAGELPFQIRFEKSVNAEKRYSIREAETYLEIILPQNRLNELQSVEAVLNLQETFKDSMDENYKKRGKFGPGGLLLSN